MSGDEKPILAACVYCGDIATSEDHLIPQTNRDRQIEGEWREVVVPACRECNSLLGAFPERGIGKRREWVHQKLRSRYAKFLRIPRWTQEELMALGPNARTDIENALKRQQWVRERLAWPN